MTAAIEPQLNKAPSTSAPPKKLSERLKEAAKTSFIGRQKELSIILDAIESKAFQEKGTCSRSTK